MMMNKEVKKHFEFCIDFYNKAITEEIKQNFLECLYNQVIADLIRREANKDKVNLEFIDKLMGMNL